MRTRGPHFELGAWNAECDRCGFKYKNYELKLEWTGLRVCDKCFEHRHPQDFVKGVADRQAPEWTRPDSVNEPFLNEGGTDVDPATDL